jgi:hypothetical protein
MKITIKSIMVFILILAIVMAISSMWGYQVSKDNACKDIGFEESTYKGGIEYCEDLEGNLYSIKMDCNWWGLDCKAKQIEIRSYKE